jgi:hypothetical protein
MAVILSFGFCQCKRKVGVAVPIPLPLLGEERFTGEVAAYLPLQKPNTTRASKSEDSYSTSPIGNCSGAIRKLPQGNDVELERS